MTINEYLQNQKIIADGSFGTYYAEKYQTKELAEKANDSFEERVLEIHTEYIQAGAKLIRTNTFASNTVVLETEIEKVKENVKNAVRLAKAAVTSEEKTEDGMEANNVFIAGDIGPIPKTETYDKVAARKEYLVIAKTMLAEGIQWLHFETFPELEEILPVILEIKSKYQVFISLSFTVNQFGYSNAGLSAKKLLAEAAGIPEIDAIGLNCGVGPSHMEQICEKLSMDCGKFIIALPNAGYPKRLQREITFGNAPEYFTEKVSRIAEMGVDIIGGCCGTNPSYIKSLSESLNTKQQQKNSLVQKENGAEIRIDNRGFFYEKDGALKQKKLIAVELAPPPNADDEKILEAAHVLQNAGVDVLTFPDSPSGRTRVDSVLMAAKVKRETGLSVMPHICCRDKNAIAMRSTFLGAHINDIHNFLIITGDPVPSLIRQTTKAVFNFDSVGLMKIAQDMNEESFEKCPMVYGGAINQGRRNFEVELSRVKKKMDAGATFFFTQPIFSEEQAERLRLVKKETGARILCGIMPLVSRRNALFMKNEMTGIPVTDEIVARYPEQGTKEEGEAVGVAIAKEIISYTEDFADGYYFSFPFNKVYLLEKILNN